MRSCGRLRMSELYQREIEEILRKVPQSVPEEPPRKSKKHLLLRRLAGTGRSLLSVAHLSSGLLIPITLGLLLLAVLVTIFLPSLFGPIVWLGFIAVILVYFLFFAAKSNPDVEKRWRGRVVEQPRAVSAWGVFWYRLRRILKP